MVFVEFVGVAALEQMMLAVFEQAWVEGLVLFELAALVAGLGVMVQEWGRLAERVQVEVDLGPLVRGFFVLFRNFDRIWNQG